jgi:uncharacterized repeat protein (TIGR03803 family)
MKTLAIALLSCVFLAACSNSAAPNAAPVVPADRSAAKHHTSTFTTIYSFSGPDGSEPEAGLVNINGTLYGTAWRAGPNSDCGTVFSLTTDGKTQQVIHTFGTDGCHPEGVTAVNTTIFGITYEGGGYGVGTVYRMNYKGVVKWSASFDGTNGARPEGNVTDYNGVTYGTTTLGGTGCGKDGCGTVFAVSRDGTLSTLWNFQGAEKGGNDGRRPESEPVVFKGTLYGTTVYGGVETPGTVYSLTTSGDEKVIHNFGGPPNDGSIAESPLTVMGNVLYGVTTYGGANDEGALFSITADGNEKLLYSFGSGKDGVDPHGSLTKLNGKLYGATFYGGTNAKCGGGCGTIFEFDPATGTETVLHNFNGVDGQYPNGGLLSLKGELFGTTYLGGDHGDGTVFTLSP